MHRDLDAWHDEVPDLGPVPERLDIEVATVRRLVDEQFPQWAHLPVEAVRPGGWDNRTFRLGDAMLVRLPSAPEYALALPKEHQWLPVLAARLPVPIPTPLGLGEPGAGYPFAWSVYDWRAGQVADGANLIDTVGLAEDLTDFLAALRGFEATDGPQPGIHNWYRGGTLRTYDDTARGALAELDGHLDVDAATAAWEDALAARWDGVDVWFHGDLAPGNLLLDDAGRLAVVLDFGTCGVGDPSCDLAVAWTVLDGDGRRILRSRLGIDEATWSRGRGWALWKALSGMASDVGDGDTGAAAQEHRIITAIVDDFGDDQDRGPG